MPFQRIVSKFKNYSNQFHEKFAGVTNGELYAFLMALSAVNGNHNSKAKETR